MKYQILFSRKNEKTIILLSAEFAHRVESIKLTLKMDNDKALVANRCVRSFPRLCLFVSESLPSSLNLSQIVN